MTDWAALRGQMIAAVTHQLPVADATSPRGPLITRETAALGERIINAISPLVEQALREREQEIARLRGALERLGSTEAFGPPFYLEDGVAHREIVNRIDYARAALAPPAP